MPWVERDTGVIVATYARKQPGVAEEFVTPLTYSIASDMPGAAVNIVTLEEEIRASAISTNFFHAWADGDVLYLIFDTLPLPAGDKTILDGDTTGPAGGLLAAHDNGARAEIRFFPVESDPETVAVDAPMGSIIVFNGVLYCKLDDGSSTNVEKIATFETGEAGGAKLNLPEYTTTDPAAPGEGDAWVLNTAGTRKIKWFDGTNKHSATLTQE